MKNVGLCRRNLLPSSSVKYCHSRCNTIIHPIYSVIHQSLNSDFLTDQILVRLLPRITILYYPTSLPRFKLPSTDALCITTMVLQKSLDYISKLLLSQLSCVALFVNLCKISVVCMWVCMRVYYSPNVGRIYPSWIQLPWRHSQSLTLVLK